MAGLPLSRAWVLVGPPLLASGPRLGSTPTMFGPNAPAVITVPLGFSNRLAPAVTSPEKSGPVAAELSPKIELTEFAVPVLRTPPPLPAAAVLSAIVEL